MKPSRKPADPRFSSGPARKHPGWSLEKFSQAALGRYHRAGAALSRLDEMMSLADRLLGVPGDYVSLLIGGSDTGAIEAALWNLLGSRPVDVFAWDRFGQDWLHDIKNELRIEKARAFSAPFGELPDLAQADPAHDIVFAWTGTSAGVMVPDGKWIPAKRDGLVICDATSAVFAVDLPWEKLDAVTWGWQKALGGEGVHGVLTLSPRALEHRRRYRAPWGIPKLLRLDEAALAGKAINTRSLLCVEDALSALRWMEGIGGLPAVIARAQENRRLVDQWVARTSWVAPLAQRAETRPPTPVTLRFSGPLAALDEGAQREWAGRFCALLEKEQAAYDIGAHRNAPPGLRLWTGGLVEAGDIEALLAWLDWAFEELAP